MIVVALIAVGLAIGGGTALIANHLAAKPATTPQVVVAMTPPPTGSYQTSIPTAVPASRRFSTAKPEQMTPAPTLPPTPEPPAPLASPARQSATVTPLATPVAPAQPFAAASTAPQPVAARTPAARAARTIAPGPLALALTPSPAASIVPVAEQFVREYLRALDRGDAAGAYAYLGGKPGEPGIVAQEEPLAKGGGLRVLSLAATPDGISSAVVHARLESRGVRYRATYYIEPFMNGPHDLVIEHVDLQQESG
ncbi:hypothetical protein EPN52_10175 [bacterium]|nr:MAG: hypothetical protein EPN52_10175 [bacterium]